MFEPKIIAFLCNWCSYAGADLAGVSRMQYPSNILIQRVMCSSRVDINFILEAFLTGADGVLIAGCHPGECHYITGNLIAKRRVEFARNLLKSIGINPKRLKLTWVSASEGKKFQEIAAEFTQEVKKLGPSKLKYRRIRDTKDVKLGEGVENLPPKRKRLIELLILLSGIKIRKKKKIEVLEEIDKILSSIGETR